jgi:hypothetical protein
MSVLLNPQLFGFLNPKNWPEKDEELDETDCLILEKIRNTGRLDTVFSWQESTCMAWYQRGYYTDTVDYEAADIHVKDAIRDKSAFFTDEQIAARRKKRLDRQQLTKLQLEQQARLPGGSSADCDRGHA